MANVNSNICSLQKKHFKYKNRERLKTREWKKIHHTNTKQIITGVLILRSNKIGSAIKIKKDIS